MVATHFFLNVHPKTGGDDHESSCDEHQFSKSVKFSILDILDWLPSTTRISRPGERILNNAWRAQENQPKKVSDYSRVLVQVVDSTYGCFQK